MVGRFVFIHINPLVLVVTREQSFPDGGYLTFNICAAATQFSAFSKQISSLRSIKSQFVFLAGAGRSETSGNNSSVSSVRHAFTVYLFQHKQHLILLCRVQSFLNFGNVWKTGAK